jgi:exopolysaccharide production protein ExoQ
MFAYPALLLTLICSAWMLKQEMKRRPGFGSALWIPLLFVAIIGSRPVSVWLMGSRGGRSGSSPLDEGFYLLVLGGSLILASVRGVNWGRLLVGNIPLLLVWAFFVLSVFWSDEPVASAKRIVKDICLLFVVAVIFTEKRPYESIRTIFIRCACFLFPLSIVCNHYFPNISRQFSGEGERQLAGITMQKNTLGEIVLVFGTMLIWDYLERRQQPGMTFRKAMPVDQMILLGMGIFLLIQSQSKTALICLVICAGLCLRPRRLTSRAINIAVVLAAFSTPFLLFFTREFANAIQPIVEALGRDMTFTGRTAIWDHITLSTVNPIIGCGYWNFWSGPKGQEISDAIHWHIPNAHCGYLDIYLDGGISALILLGVFLIAYGFRLARPDVKNGSFQIVRLAFFTITIISNLSESSYFRVGLLWFTTLLLTVDFPRKQRQKASATPWMEVEAAAPERQERVAAFSGETVPNSPVQLSARRNFFNS